MKMFIVNDHFTNPFEFERMGFELVRDFEKADIVQFLGGHDVSPFIYGEKNTHSFNDPMRDFYEASYFAIAERMGKPMVGICRGGQFLNVMCGGKMIQDVGGHTHDHMLNGVGFEPVKATSTHHQMMVVGPLGRLIGWGETEHDIEVVHYPHKKCLCFQPHPEYGRHPKLRDLYVELIHRELFGKG